jgi:hypothetical protein
MSEAGHPFTYVSLTDTCAAPKMPHVEKITCNQVHKSEQPGDIGWRLGQGWSGVHLGSLPQARGELEKNKGCTIRLLLLFVSDPENGVMQTLFCFVFREKSADL